MAPIYKNSGIDPFNGDAKNSMRVQSGFYGGSYDTIIAPVSPNYPDADADVTATRYFIKFPGVIDRDETITIRDNTLAVNLTPVASNPGVNEYVPPPASSRRRDQIEINAAQAGNNIEYDLYIEVGTMSGDEFQDIENTSVTTVTANITDLNVTGNLILTSLDVIILEYRVAPSANGGTATAGSWATRPLNTEVLDTGNICTLAANKFTLDSGKYIFECSGVFFNTNNSFMRLYNTSDASAVLQSIDADPQSAANYNCSFHGYFDISTSKTFEIQYLTQNTWATNGLGGGAGGTASPAMSYNTFLSVRLYRITQ
jgi:hypothetical protein